MADAQDDPGDELAWDLRALTAAEAVRHTEGPGKPGESGGEGAAEHRDLPAVRAFSPSLHLNLAADYLKLHRHDAARTHLRLARAAAAELADDRQGRGVRAAIDRLELRLRER
ncbi:hypothetical protein SCALM49S_04291 [Streptomyces californicus]